VSDLMYAYEYEPHRWSGERGISAWMDPERERLAHEPEPSRGGRKRVEVELRRCENCGVVMERRRFGTRQILESAPHYAKRRTCDLQCRMELERRRGFGDAEELTGSGRAEADQVMVREGGRGE
jgi:hypothetical protein